jgi:hypothetical protein
MIIYGSRASHLKSVHLQNESCPNCNQQGSVTLSTFTRYAHIFWIPLFSVGRFSVSQCGHCKQALEQKQMPAQIAAHHHRNLAETRLPLWQFTGLALIAVLVAFGVYGSAADKEQQAAFLKNPMAGDVYELKTKSGSYTTFKIVNVKPDTVEVRFNDYETNKITGISTIDIEENYSDTTYVLPAVTIREMFAAGEVVDVNRN